MTLDVADAWCAAFMWHKTKDAPPAIVNRRLPRISKKDDSTLLAAAVATEIDRLREEYGFFHWHLEFPDIFRVAETAGCECRRRRPAGRAGSLPARQPAMGQGRLRGQEVLQRGRAIHRRLAGKRRTGTHCSNGNRSNPEEGARYRRGKATSKGHIPVRQQSERIPKCAEGLTRLA